jgi:hypothetical protein
MAVKWENADSDSQNRSSIEALVASSTNIGSVKRGARSANHSWSQPSICMSSPRHERR